MKTFVSFFALALLLWSNVAQAELLGDEWITEKEMKRQSAFAREHNLLLVDLRCKFNESVKNPGRSDVLFRADFKILNRPEAWGWTFEANAPFKGPEQQARAAGFVVASEEYFEVTGVTWVRCKVWHRPR